jgi:uncharacterized OsmC-like protein
MTGDDYCSVHNDTDAEAELLSFSTRLAAAREAGRILAVAQHPRAAPDRIGPTVKTPRRCDVSDGNLREYRARAHSTGVFGRVLCDAREQHFVIDGPVWNGCPGEALTPGEAFLAAVAACGVELVEVIARDDGDEVGTVDVAVYGAVDRENPVREDLTVFNRVRMRFEIEGTSQERAESLVERVGRRCPLYGSVAASAGELELEVRAH